MEIIRDSETKAIREGIFKLHNISYAVESVFLNELFQIYLDGDIPPEEVFAFIKYVERRSHTEYVKRWYWQLFTERFKLLAEAVYSRLHKEMEEYIENYNKEEN